MGYLYESATTCRPCCLQHSPRNASLYIVMEADHLTGFCAYLITVLDLLHEIVLCLQISCCIESAQKIRRGVEGVPCLQRHK